MPSTLTTLPCSPPLHSRRPCAAWESHRCAARDRKVHLCGTLDGEEALVARRTECERTLGAPAPLLPALQVSAAGGWLPPPAPNVRAYFQLPVMLARGAF